MLKYGKGRATAWLLVLMAFTTVPSLGFGWQHQCRERTQLKGSLEKTEDSNEDTCWCGILIKTHRRTCDTKKLYIPARGACTGPVSELIDCAYTGTVYAEYVTYRCKMKLASIGFSTTAGTVGVTLPVCIGTSCEEVSRSPAFHLASGNEVPCRPSVQEDQQ